MTVCYYCNNYIPLFIPGNKPKCKANMPTKKVRHNMESLFIKCAGFVKNEDFVD